MLKGIVRYSDGKPASFGTAEVCAGKQSFRSPQLATEVASRQRKNERDRYEAYRCPLCGRWHIGHSKFVTRPR